MIRSLRPDYYEDFACLMGQCRLNCCCENWQIPLMKEEYEAIRAAARRNGGPLAGDIARALGREGSPAGAYAHIRHGADGACPLCSPDGLCRLHAACGPEALGSVCRTFPRSHVLWNGRHRQCCSAGCQATIELLKKRTDPLTFVESDFVRDGWPEDRGSRMVGAEALAKRPLLGRLEELQETLTRLLQQRKEPMERRMARLAAALYRLDEAERAGQPREDFELPEPVCCDPGAGLSEALAVVALFTTVFQQQGSQWEQQAIQKIWRACGVSFQNGARGVELHLNRQAYLEAARQREKLWQQEAPCLWEHLLVNQVFQGLLPFGEPEASVWDNALYFCAVYAILRFLAAGTAEQGWQATEDILVSGLRKYTHSTQLMPRTVAQLRRRGMATSEGLAALLAL